MGVASIVAAWVFVAIKRKAFLIEAHHHRTSPTQIIHTHTHHTYTDCPDVEVCPSDGGVVGWWDGGIVGWWGEEEESSKGMKCLAQVTGVLEITYFSVSGEV